MRHAVGNGLEPALVDGRHLVSIVGLRFGGGRLGRLPVPRFTQLNVRTYVEWEGRTAVFFLRSYATRRGPAGDPLRRAVPSRADPRPAGRRPCAVGRGGPRVPARRRPPSRASSAVTRPDSSKRAASRPSACERGPAELARRRARGAGAGGRPARARLRGRGPAVRLLRGRGLVLDRGPEQVGQSLCAVVEDPREPARHDDVHEPRASGPPGTRVADVVVAPPSRPERPGSGASAPSGRTGRRAGRRRTSAAGSSP